MHLWGEAISYGDAFLLFMALGLALGFECVNGFHDTANAVATVIYTHSLRPIYAVVWSGIWNLIGVLTSSGLVAYSIIGLLPRELVMNIGTGNDASQFVGFAMIFSLLLSAIIWNVGTWYFGLPVSSTHSLVGAILGVGVAHAILSGQEWTQGLNWEEIRKVILALLISPLVGFAGAALLLLAGKLMVHREDLFRAPEKDETPPTWIRGTLIGTCTGVSFAHGYNDGQKGMGVIMLILIGILPGAFALQNPDKPDQFQTTIQLSQKAQGIFQSQSQSKQDAGAPSSPTPSPSPTPANGSQPIASILKPSAPSPSEESLSQFTKTGKITPQTYVAFSDQCRRVQEDLSNIKSFNDLPENKREPVRRNIYLLADGISKLIKLKVIKNTDQDATLKSFDKDLKTYTEYIPVWVKVAVALALGLGTMVGWKRVVVTVGEKIGKAHLTYAQGGSAEIITFITVLGAGLQGWPVSTTHVLSSGIAGTMAANRSGLQTQTLINILLAWVLTLPACVFLGACLFSGSLYFLFNVVGIR